MLEEILPKLEVELSEKVAQFRNDLMKYDFKIILLYLFKKENFDIFTEDGFLQDDAYLMSYAADAFLSNLSDSEKVLPDEDTVENIVKNISAIVSTYMMKLYITGFSEGLANLLKIDSLFVERAFFQVIETDILTSFLEPIGANFQNNFGFKPLDVIKFKNGLMKFIVGNLNSIKSYDDLYTCLDIDCAMISKEADLSISEIESIVTFFSISTSDNTECLPRRKNPVVNKPILNFNNTYLCVNPLNLIKKLRINIEEKIREEQHEWGNYCSRRAQILENETLKTLQNVFSLANFHRNVKYRFQKNQAIFEADIIIDVDKYLILVECKSANLSEPAKFGYQKRLDKDISEIVHEAHAQCKRAFDYISSDESVQFEENREYFSIKKDKYQKIYLISVTLDNLELITANIHNILTLPEEAIVVTLSLYDLKVISEMIRNSTEFLLYLDRRERSISEGKIHAHDELDIFTTFLNTGLIFKDESSFDFIEITNFSDEIDQYYIKNRKTLKPQLKVFYKTIQKLKEIELMGLDGWLALSKELISYSGVAQQNIWKNVSKILKKSKKKGRSDFSICEKEGKTGITFYAENSENENAVNKLESYVNRKFVETGMKYWFVVIFYSNVSHRIQNYCMFENKDFF